MSDPTNNADGIDYLSDFDGPDPFDNFALYALTALIILVGIVLFGS